MKKYIFFLIFVSFYARTNCNRVLHRSCRKQCPFRGIINCMKHQQYHGKPKIISDEEEYFVFCHNYSGPDWTKSGFKRKPELIQRFSQNNSHAQAGTDENYINQFFNYLETDLLGVLSLNISNYDKTNHVDDSGQLKLARRVPNIRKRIIWKLLHLLWYVVMTKANLFLYMSMTKMQISGKLL